MPLDSGAIPGWSMSRARSTCYAADAEPSQQLRGAQAREAARIAESTREVPGTQVLSHGDGLDARLAILDFLVRAGSEWLSKSMDVPIRYLRPRAGAQECLAWCRLGCCRRRLFCQKTKLRRSVAVAAAFQSANVDNPNRHLWSGRCKTRVQHSPPRDHRRRPRWGVLPSFQVRYTRVPSQPSAVKRPFCAAAQLHNCCCCCCCCCR
ncbi:hypothetical protein BCR34DRAFT_594956 [Clohesyomyces aquaticus]|uniref:Uncharacterized protein n=1 Tax=Clohesyomyces aquaticus TaxID=1231657 RepID=A0A1Y1Y317_9PLEO|nr:hypothetical protein BCR34DRAFT_594956 [Clohesyomyces aquaticus]